MPQTPEQIINFFVDLEAHPTYSADPAVRGIVDHYRDRLLYSASIQDAATPAENQISQILNDLKNSLNEYHQYAQDSIEAVFPGLHLREQYCRQLGMAQRSGMFECEAGVQDFGNGHRTFCDFPYFDRFGRIQAMPDWDEVKNALLNNRELVKFKASQGFTKLLIVPFGYDLATLAGHFAGISEDQQEQGIFDPRGNRSL